MVIHVANDVGCMMIGLNASVASFNEYTSMWIVQNQNRSLECKERKASTEHASSQ